MSRLLSAGLLFVCWAVQAQDADWSAYLGGPHSGQYSALDQINPKNVGDLKVAWTYDSEPDNETPKGQIQCNPIVIDGVFVCDFTPIKSVRT